MAPTREENSRFWGEEYDWSDLGESWTPGEVWRQAILNQALRPHLESAQRILEIGPGGGRWTTELIASKPSELHLVDLTRTALDLCSERFGELPGLQLHQNDGATLPFLDDDSIDLLWSFDVFVHIEKPEVASYFAEFARVLRPGAKGIVHYATIDRAQCKDPREGWRADFRSTDLVEILEANGLEALEDLYDPHISHTNSSIAVFRRP